ncbi:CAAX prenyl protease 2 [Platanthera zijinensis]|uniref:intramembrane prenyl-peptidase Rce1 n=1 Tax=Platanthera zijinensis TaxID=2320716 RepID=A0AAP0BGU4_9ASPA
MTMAAVAALHELPTAAGITGMSIEGSPLSRSVALIACVVMALGYVLVLYVPTFVLRLPPSTSLESFLIRRFTCALVFSAVSALASAYLLGIGRFRDVSVMLSVYGIRKDHMWQALVFPLLLSSLLYTGSLVSKLLFLLHGWRGRAGNSFFDQDLCHIFVAAARISLEHALDCVHNMVAWRNYVVAPFTEELVFRACMIPLLLCSGFHTQSIIFFGPIFFSLAHLHHCMELYYQQRYSFLKALSVVGLQLGYTVVFGWYATFLFIRTGNIISAIIAHIFCNAVGLPIVFSPRTRGLATIAFIVGLASFSWFLFPASNPILYNSSLESCSCWQGCCSWH